MGFDGHETANNKQSSRHGMYGEWLASRFWNNVEVFCVQDKDLDKPDSLEARGLHQLRIQSRPRWIFLQ